MSVWLMAKYLDLNWFKKTGNCFVVLVCLNQKNYRKWSVKSLVTESKAYVQLLSIEGKQL